MKSLKKKDVEAIKFANLIAGEAFYYESTLYMKTSPDERNGQNICAVRLEDGARCEFDDNLPVILANVHIEDD